MLLLTVGLILVGFVLLLIGLFADVDALVYAAIGCAMAAGLALIVYSRLSRRTAAPAQAGGSAPAQAGGSAPAQGWAPPPPRAEPAPWSPPPPVQEAEPEPEPAPTWSPPPRPSEPTVAIETISEDGPDTEVVAPVGADGFDDGDFPIADYDELRVSEILPLLPELDLDELEVVRERELEGKRRTVVIDRIDDQMDELEGEVAPVAAPVAAAPVAGGFPIADYESRSVDEIVALIPDLSDDELDMLAEREEQGQNRAAVLDAIDDQFEEVEIGDEELAPAVPLPVEEVPVKKVAAKKVAAKKVPATKVTAKKVPATRVTAKKVTAKKVPATRVTAKKVTAKKVTAEKVPATRVTAKKVTAKKAPVKKVVAKKAPVKKGPAKKVAVKAVKSPRTAAVKKVAVKKVVKKVGRPAKKR